MSEATSGAPRAPKPTIEQPADAAASANGAVAAESPKSAREKSGRSKKPKAGSAKPNAAAAGGFQDATAGFFQALGRAAWACANTHPHTVLYGLIGFVLAVLILAIGLWDTIVIAVFVIVGVVIGQMVDGDNAIVNFFSRLFDRHR